MKDNRKQFLQKKLFELGTELITDTRKMDQFAHRWQGGFHSYSFQNLMLIWVQKEDATLCAGFHQWKKHKRYVKKGEEAIWILAPGIAVKEVEKENKETGEVEIEEKKTIQYFFPVHVFDISQTEGKPLEIGNTEIKGNGNVTVEQLKEIFPDYEVKISNGIEDGSTDGKRIKVSDRKSKEQMTCAYLHELSHILLEHIGKRGKKLDSKMKEIEAESCSYLVSSCLGIDNQGAKYYVSHYGGDKLKLRHSSLKVISTAEKILRKIKPERFKSLADNTSQREERQMSLSLI